MQKSVPRYALGGRVNQGEPLIDDMEFSDYGLGGPMMGAETVGFDLANPMLGGPEQGGSYTGGMGGGDSRTAAERLQAILDVNPYVAPTEGMNLDPITSRGQTGYYFANELGLPARYGDVGSPKPADPATYDPNAKYIEPMPGFVPVDKNATYRLVNGGTDGSVVYAGAGEEGLRNVFQQANQLTMDNPKNAYWGVEVLDPATGQYKRVAENQGPNGLGIVGDIAGVALPIAAAIATGGASLGVQIAAGAAAGGLGGFLAGKDPLTSALIGGASAGIGNVSGLNKAIGGALGKAGGALGLGGAAADAAVGGLSSAAGEATGDIVVIVVPQDAVVLVEGVTRRWFWCAARFDVRCIKQFRRLDWLQDASRAVRSTTVTDNRPYGPLRWDKRNWKPSRSSCSKLQRCAVWRVQTNSHGLLAQGRTA